RAGDGERQRLPRRRARPRHRAARDGRQPCRCRVADALEPYIRMPTGNAKANQTAGRALALCHALLSEQGEVSGRRLAAYALSAYQSLEPDARALFFDSLAEEFAPDPKEVDSAAARYRLDASSANLIRLQTAVEPPRQELFRRANMAPGGTAVLLDMRRELL